MAAEKKENVKANLDKSENVRLVVYDFDQTITSIHLYHELNNGDGDQEKQLSKMSDNRLLQVFGGKARIKRLNHHFTLLKKNDIEMAIISYGYVDVIKKALSRMELYDSYFKESIIIGCDSVELDEADGSKAVCIESTFKKSKTRQNNLKAKQILFVDDDQYNIRECDRSKICKTIAIQPRQGMSDAHMKQIEAMIGVQQQKQ